MGAYGFGRSQRHWTIKRCRYLVKSERSRLAAYVDRFNARDFDAIREMLAEEVRLDLVNRIVRTGRDDVARYFDHYARVHDWLLVPGLVDRRPAILVCDPDEISRPPKSLYRFAMER